MTNTTENESAKTAAPRLRLIKDPAEASAKRDAVLSQFFAEQKQRRTERRAAVEAAMPALERICRNVLTQRSGQCYKVRALLYSLYNGQATSLIEILGLDWEIRKDLCAVLLAFGFEDADFSPCPGGAEVTRGSCDFFYAEMKAAITKAGQWDWFIEAHEEESEVGA